MDSSFFGGLGWFGMVDKSAIGCRIIGLDQNRRGKMDGSEGFVLLPSKLRGLGHTE